MVLNPNGGMESDKMDLLWIPWGLQTEVQVFKMIVLLQTYNTCPVLKIETVTAESFGSHTYLNIEISTG